MKEGERDGVVADTFWADGKIWVNKGTCDDGAVSTAEECIGKEGRAALRRLGALRRFRHTCNEQRSPRS
jgi:hypothetical protein